jgi:hypothetical protein
MEVIPEKEIIGSVTVYIYIAEMLSSDLTLIWDKTIVYWQY